MRTLLLTAVLVSSCPAAFAQEPAAPAAKAPAAMTIGSPAPTPEVSDFIRGEQPKWFEKGKTYVVEFWATWCGPCRASMPHLSDLADRYKDSVVVVGISDEQPDVVRGFLDKDEWKKKARYNLAADPDRSVHRDYMEAAGKNGIPTAFIVRDGKVQWIGHPMQMDEPLAKVVDGTWDAKAAKKEFDDAAATARKQQERRRAIGEARKAGDWKKIIAMMDEDIAGATGSQKRQAQMSKFRTMIGAAKMPKEGYSFGRELVAASKGDAEALNEIAWYVLDDKAVGVRDIPFALETAKAAIAAAGAPEPAIMDTLARAYWESGDKAKALEWQEKAVKAAGDDEDVAGQMKETLERYREAGAVIAFAKTGPDCFNEFGLRDPAGHMITLLERPTHPDDAFDPSRVSPAVGEFLAFSLPSAAPEVSAGFWRALGARPIDGRPCWPALWLDAAGLVVAIHDEAVLDRPALVFHRHGVAPGTRLESPEGTLLVPVG